MLLVLELNTSKSLGRDVDCILFWGDSSVSRVGLDTPISPEFQPCFDSA